jgi:uncharacterized protein YdeI (YjbR/CyaY-like superfamily)
MTATHFPTAEDFRRWLERHHGSEKEIVVRLRKKASRMSGLTYPEALDEALCFGWIDGVRRSIDIEAYSVRFTPRKASSVWSRVNLRHYDRLDKQGRLAAPGRAAHAKRDPRRSGIYSFETRPQDLPPDFVRQFQAKPAAWRFFLSQPPGYRRTASFWVVSAKQEPTRLRRLATLIADSAGGRRLGMLARSKGGPPGPAPH